MRIVTAAVLTLILAGSFPFPLAGSTPRVNSQGIPTGTNNPRYTLITFVPALTWNGTTLFGDSNNGSVVEVNMQGQVTWSYTFPKGTASSVVITGLMYVPGTNDVLFTVSNPQSLRGAYEVNRQGQIVWKYVDQEAFHDAVRLPSGDTLIDNCYAEAFSPWPYADPQIVEVNQQGQVVWSWAVKTVYQNNSKYANIRNGNGPTDCEWAHTNEALRLPNGDTMVSLRNFNLTVIVGPSGQLVKAFDDPCVSGCGLIGHLVWPHSPLPLPNGHYLISEPVGFSDVVEYNPSTNGAVWRWPLPSQNLPGAYFIRAGQRLSNGDTLVTDSYGQLIEVAQSGQVVWKLKCSCYDNAQGVSGSPFFQAERLSYMPPGFTVSSPSSHTTYNAGSIPLTVSAGTDLGNLTYSLRNNQNGSWILKNATLIQNVYKDSLDAPTTTKGPSSLDLASGNYTLRLSASSSGYGYKAFVQQKRINYASHDITFLVSAAVTTSSTTSTTASSTLTATSSTRQISTATTSSIVSTKSTATSKTSSIASTPTATTATSSTTSTGGGGGIPEFPYQPLAAAIFISLAAASYLLARRRPPSERRSVEPR